MTAIDTGTEDLRAELDSGVAVITMNRPDRRNAFSPAMVSALGAVLARVETDDAVGCVVLTGAGGAFWAGGGLSLALACDLRYAASGAVQTTAFNKVAFDRDYGGTWFLTHMVGTSKA